MRPRFFVTIVVTIVAVSRFETDAFAQGKPGKPAPPPSGGDLYDEGPAAKQDPAANMAAEGKLLLDAGKIDEACAKLAESARLAERSATLLDLATCRDKQGKKAQAYRVLDRAGTVAQKEKQPKNALAAVSRQKGLEKSIAFVTIAAPREPMRVTVDGDELSPADFGRAFAVDLGERTVAATADGKKRWEQKVNATPGARTSIEIPALETATEPVGPAVTSEPNGSEPPKPPPKPEEPKPPIDEERQGRVVIEGGFLGGFQFSYVPRAPSGSLDGLAYKFATGAGTNIDAACGDTKTVPGSGDCTGDFRARAGAAVGGQLFVGYSVTKRLHMGGRVVAAPLLPRGEVIAGGPSLSVRATDALWLGATAVVGFERHRALVLSARGSVPDEHVSDNGGNKQVEVPLGPQYGATPTIFASILAGAQIEIAYAVLGVSAPGYKKVQAPSKLATGSLLVGAWPMVMGGPRGLTLTLPVGFGYRFY